MNPPFTIRPMEARDAADVASLVTQLGYPCSESDIVRRFAVVQDDPDACLMVAVERDRTLIGWLHVQAIQMLEAEPRAEIWGIVVAESARRGGVGRALVQAAEAWAVACGLHTIGVRSNIVRVEAKGFYEHLGYKVLKVQNAFRRELAPAPQPPEEDRAS